MRQLLPREVFTAAHSTSHDDNHPRLNCRHLLPQLNDLSRGGECMAACRSYTRPRGADGYRNRASCAAHAALSDSAAPDRARVSFLSGIQIQSAATPSGCKVTRTQKARK